jgi:hypothetical protein
LCRNKRRPTKCEQAKAIYSELAIVRDSAAITGVLAETQGQAKEWESFMMEKRMFSGVIRGCWHRTL